MAQRNGILPDGQAPVGASEPKIPHDDHEGWTRLAFDIFVAAVLALIAAVLVDLALHPSQSEAMPSLECDSTVTLAVADETARPRGAGFAQVDRAVFSCLVRSKGLELRA